eukprot:m.175325 g.175325  ORF g.175325 m.175325 type:complete len:146 (+) comp16776_c0_seq3:279-716(+)
MFTIQFAVIAACLLSAQGQNVMSFLDGKRDLRDFARAIRRANLDDELSDTNTQWTVFAPDDADRCLDRLSGSALQDAVKSYFVKDSRLSFNDVDSLATIEAWSGAQLEPKRNNKNQLRVNRARIDKRNRNANNAIIHILTRCYQD